MRRRALVGSLLSGLLLAGCGTATRLDFSGHSRPPAAADVSVYVNDSQILVSPSMVRAGLVEFDITNQADRHELLALASGSSPLAHTADLAPGQTAELTAALRPGRYSIAGSGFLRGNPAPVRAGRLTVGSASKAGDSALLQP